MAKIDSLAIVGLGYVGLPLALLAGKKGYTVHGIDVDPVKMKKLAGGTSYIDDVTDQEIQTSSVKFTDSFEVVSSSDAVIVCVPTPVDHDKNPDLSIVKNAVTSVVPHLKDKALLVIESTINPGVCDETVIPLIEATGKKVGKDVYLAHCPERINPGDPVYNVSNINRVVGANSEKELEVARALYEDLIDAEIKPMNSLKEAEAVKVVENSFRDINIAFVNELAMSFHKLGINVENVIDGAATKPFSFMPHRPGAGVGGHCIPVDPYYLIEYARTNGFEHRFLRLARDINESMPNFTVDLLIESLNKLEMPIKNTKIALLGLSYKPNVGDERESPALVIKSILEEHQANLSIYDPHLSQHSTASNLEDALKDAAAVVIATGHDEFKALNADYLNRLGIKVVIDGRNMLRTVSQSFTDSNIIYKGIGI